jgi:hypothetical protein
VAAGRTTSGKTPPHMRRARLVQLPPHGSTEHRRTTVLNTAAHGCLGKIAMAEMGALPLPPSHGRTARSLSLESLSRITRGVTT